MPSLLFSIFACCKGDEVVFATAPDWIRGIGNGVLACGFIGEIEDDERRIERIIGPCRRFLNAEGVEVAIRGNWSTGISAPAEEILRLRVNEKSRYGTSAIREQPKSEEPVSFSSGIAVSG